MPKMRWVCDECGKLYVLEEDARNCEKADIEKAKEPEKKKRTILRPDPYAKVDF